MCLPAVRGSVTAGWEAVLAKDGHLKENGIALPFQNVTVLESGSPMKDGIFVGKFMNLSDPQCLL